MHDCAASHARPQAPQLRPSVTVLTSQPSAAPPSQSAKPGAHEKVHASPAPQRAITAFMGATQGSLRTLRPSALQIERATKPAGQVLAPGTHIQFEHLAPTHGDDAEHASVVKLVPSAPHTRTLRASAHEVVPGTQSRGEHAPSRQVSPVGQGADVYPSPSGAQTLRSAVIGSQLVSPGVHTARRHRSARQLCPVGQSDSL